MVFLFNLDLVKYFFLACFSTCCSTFSLRVFYFCSLFLVLSCSICFFSSSVIHFLDLFLSFLSSSSSISSFESPSSSPSESSSPETFSISLPSKSPKSTFCSSSFGIFSSPSISLIWSLLISSSSSSSWSPWSSAISIWSGSKSSPSLSPSSSSKFSSSSLICW